MNGHTILRKRQVVIGLILSSFFLFNQNARAALPTRYGETLCDDPAYHCITVEEKVIEQEVKTKKGTRIKKRRVSDTWESLWPDEREREIVKKVNRMAISLHQGMIIAVPNDMTGKSFMDFAPYPQKLDPSMLPEPKSKNITKNIAAAQPIANGVQNGGSAALTSASGPTAQGENSSAPALQTGLTAEAPTPFPGEKVLIWDPALLAWAAYDVDGNLVRWGPGVGGKDYCPDVERGCHTRVGVFKISFKGGPYHRSGKYPVGCGQPDENGKVAACALMPWYMQFAPPGYGFHGSNNVPGRNASHGCVRLFNEDAEWLNKNFVEIGTRVIIKPYP